MDALAELQKWFLAHCDGDWEHAYGITIETAANPGWYLAVDFGETTLEDVPFDPVDVVRSEKDRYSCLLRDGKFIGFGGPTNLAEIIGVFLEWAKHADDSR